MLTLLSMLTLYTRLLVLSITNLFLEIIVSILGIGVPFYLLDQYRCQRIRAMRVQ
jgi:hypothetical protein